LGQAAATLVPGRTSGAGGTGRRLPRARALAGAASGLGSVGAIPLLWGARPTSRPELSAPAQRAGVTASRQERRGPYRSKVLPVRIGPEERSPLAGRIVGRTVSEPLTDGYCQ